MECIFCQIVAGKIPSAKVFEDAQVMAFLSIRPIQPGHTVVILKKHFATLSDIPSADLQYLIKAVQHLSFVVKEAVKADGFIVSMNNGRVAGQEIDHAHFHIVPRFKSDGLVPWKEGSYQEGELEQYAEKIRKLLL